MCLVLAPPASAAGRRSGFTVIELLAIVAIVGTLGALAVPRTHEALERARVARAIGDIRSLQVSLDSQDSLPDNLTFIGPLLDPWGRAYQYNKFPPNKQVPQGARRDRFLVPINSTYDLFSLGKDGETSPSLNAQKSQDDVVRGNDGGFIGLAAKY